MSPERRQKINRFIAEKCGWAPCFKGCDGRTWRRPDDSGCQEHLPDYCGDLNACHEAQVILTDLQWQKYGNMLVLLVPGHWPKNLLNATAAQRAEALYRVLGGEE